MEQFFLTFLMLVCGDFNGGEKALCIKDMVLCRESLAPFTEKGVYNECLKGVYLDYYLLDKR